MRLIPVIDLKDGLVVYARGGNRANYLPLQSPLCSSAHPIDVVQGYLQLYPFTTVYIADLNAIAGQPCHQLQLQQLFERFTYINFWLDQGYQNTPGAFAAYPNHIPVLGSESYTQENYPLLHCFERYILSLDFAGNTPLGASSLFTPSALWPQTIILMTLQQVGSQQGPAFTTLQHFKQHYSEYQFVAAGGVRGVQDIQTLRDTGIHNVLLASALHNGGLSQSDLLEIILP